MRCCMVTYRTSSWNKGRSKRRRKESSLSRGIYHACGYNFSWRWGNCRGRERKWVCLRWRHKLRVWQRRRVNLRRAWSRSASERTWLCKSNISTWLLLQVVLLEHLLQLSYNVLRLLCLGSESTMSMLLTCGLALSFGRFWLLRRSLDWRSRMQRRRLNCRRRDRYILGADLLLLTAIHFLWVILLLKLILSLLLVSLSRLMNRWNMMLLLLRIIVRKPTAMPLVRLLMTVRLMLIRRRFFLLAIGRFFYVATLLIRVWKLRWVVVETISWQFRTNIVLFYQRYFYY